MTNPELYHVIQRNINNGHYSEAVDNINIVCSSDGGSLPDSLVPQLFPSLMNADEEYVERCCKALERLLEGTPVEVVIRQMEVQLKQGFDHHSPIVKCLCLRQLQRAVKDRRILKLIGEVGIMKHAILLLADEDSGVVKDCNKTLVALAGYDDGVMILFSDQGVKLLKEVMEKSDTVRYRVFDVIIDSSLVSGQALEYAQTSGFITKMLEDLESCDVLLQLTALENVSRLSDSPTAYSILKNLGIFKGIGAWLGLNQRSHSNASYTVPSVIKLLAKLAQKHNVDLKQLCEECPEYLTGVCALLDTNDLSVKLACVDVLTLINTRVDGKCVFLNTPCATPAVQELAYQATKGTEDVKNRALVALAHIFSTPEVYIPEFAAQTEEWYRKCCGGGLVKDTLQLLSYPAPGRQCAAASLLTNLAVHRYGIEGITSVPGWSERMLDRRYAVDREAQSLRYSLIMAINRSPVLQEFADRDIINKLTKYVNEGAHYSEHVPTAILEL